MTPDTRRYFFPVLGDNVQLPGPRDPKDAWPVPSKRKTWPCVCQHDPTAHDARGCRHCDCAGYEVWWSDDCRSSDDDNREWWLLQKAKGKKP